MNSEQQLPKVDVINIQTGLPIVKQGEKKRKLNSAHHRRIGIIDDTDLDLPQLSKDYIADVKTILFRAAKQIEDMIEHPQHFNAEFDGGRLTAGFDALIVARNNFIDAFTLPYVPDDRREFLKIQDATSFENSKNLQKNSKSSQENSKSSQENSKSSQKDLFPSSGPREGEYIGKEVAIGGLVQK